MAADEAQQPTTRDYTVLHQVEDGQWVPVGTYSAGGASGARRAALAELKAERAVLVAVPVRSWQPMVVSVKLVASEEPLGGMAEQQTLDDAIPMGASA